MSTAPDSAAMTCPNCDQPRTGRHCSNCGQKDMPLAPTLGYFLDELTHELANVDGKIYRSLRLLLTRPGFLTRELFAGRRASYVSPIRLYLIASLLAFGLRALFGVYDNVNFQYIAGPGEVLDPALLERAAEVERTLGATVNLWLPRAMFVLVPLFAALVMLVRRRGGYTYPQHLYFALHLHAVLFLTTAARVLFGLVPLPYVAPVASALIMVYLVAYSFVAFRRVYDTTIWGALWRLAIVFLLYMPVLILAIIAIAAPTALPFFVGQPGP